MGLEVMDMVLKIENVKKSFGEKILFTNLNLEIEKGEVFALIGPNGVGKTTLMRLLLGWDKDYEGEIFRKAGIKIGYSPETPEFPQILTGQQVLEHYMEVRGMDKASYKEESKMLMEKVGLPLGRDTLVKNYSKGMKQRLAVAQSLIGNPDVLLLDEPSSGLDFFGQQQMQILIGQLKDEGKAILLNSHLLFDVEQVADRGYIIMNEKTGRSFVKEDFKETRLSDMFMEIAEEANYEGSN